MQKGKTNNNSSNSWQRLWIFIALLNLLFLLILSLEPTLFGDFILPGSITCLVILFIFGFMSEYIDSSIGLGFGTIIMLLLISAGYSFNEIFPAILIVEGINGLLAASVHHRVGNVEFKREDRALEVVKIIIPAAIIGAIPAFILKKLVSVEFLAYWSAGLLLIMGAFILLRRKVFGECTNHKLRFLGLLAGFSKALTGSGYGPIVIGGQVLLRIPEKSAIGITLLTEGVICSAGFVYILLFDSTIIWSIILPVMLGSLLAVPPACRTTKALEPVKLHHFIGLSMLILGVFAFFKIIVT